MIAMFTQEDFTYLKQYKRQVFFKFIVCLPISLPLFIALVSAYAFTSNSSYVRTAIVIFIINCCISGVFSTIEYFAVRAYLFLLNLSCIMLFFAGNWFAAGLLFLNTSYLHWESRPNIWLIVLFLMSLFTSPLLEFSNWKRNKQSLIDDGILELDTHFYNILKELSMKKYIRYKSIKVLFTILSVIIYIYIAHTTSISKAWPIKSATIENIPILIGFLAIHLSYLFNIMYGGLFIRAFLIWKSDKKDNSKLYTTLKKFYDQENQINDWRASRGLKPVNLRSPFFFGNIEK